MKLKYKSIDRSGDFDQQALPPEGMGQDNWGDFSQYSLHGVDFGEYHDENYGIEPNNLKGDHTMYGADYQQIGTGYEMGVVPEGMSGDYQQMGIVPAGIGHYHQQMGLVPSGLGKGYYQQVGHSHYQQMGQGFMDQLNKPLFNVAGFGVTPLVLAGAGAALWFLQRQGAFKQFGF